MLFQQRYEIVWRDVPVNRIGPTRQDLEADNLSARDINDGLERGPDVAFGNRANKPFPKLALSQRR